MIFVNFKTYEQGTGENALALVKVLEQVATRTQVKVVPVLQATDIKEAVVNTKLEVWTQHVDPFKTGPHTGYVIPEAVYEDGAIGTFLSHSEDKFKKFEDLKKAVSRAKEVGLRTLIFAGDLSELKKIIKLKPTYVAYEPPELVGSKTTSVTESKPGIVVKAVEKARQAGIPLVVGAGIKSGEDVRKSVEYGAVGVAVASHIVTAREPEKELLELAEAYK